MCKACKTAVFHCQICKFVTFLLPTSSWLLKLPYTVRLTPSVGSVTSTGEEANCLGGGSYLGWLKNKLFLNVLFKEKYQTGIF